MAEKDKVRYEKELRHIIETKITKKKAPIDAPTNDD